VQQQQATTTPYKTTTDHKMNNLHRTTQLTILPALWECSTTEIAERK